MTDCTLRQKCKKKKKKGATNLFRIQKQIYNRKWKSGTEQYSSRWDHSSGWDQAIRERGVVGAREKTARKVVSARNGR